MPGATQHQVGGALGINALIREACQPAYPQPSS